MHKNMMEVRILHRKTIFRAPTYLPCKVPQYFLCIRFGVYDDNILMHLQQSTGHTFHRLSSESDMEIQFYQGAIEQLGWFLACPNA